MVDLTLLHIREELPEARAARLEAEADDALRRRAEVLEKPEEERTRQDHFVLEGFRSRFLDHSYGHSDWDDLALECHRPGYFPASPLREPFKALFEHAPADALRLVAELSNHAIAAWRQLHRLDPDAGQARYRLNCNFPGETSASGAPRVSSFGRAAFGRRAARLRVYGRRELGFG